MEGDMWGLMEATLDDTSSSWGTWNLKWPLSIARKDSQWRDKENLMKKPSTQNVSFLQGMQEQRWSREGGNGQLRSAVN